MEKEQNNKKQKITEGMSLKIEILEGSKIKIKGEIPVDKMKPFQKKALDKIKKETQFPGFRQGKATDEMVFKKFGQMYVLEEASRQALSHYYPYILIEEKIDAIGRPEINVSKIVPNQALGFTIETSVMPEISLADYKKIAREAEKIQKPEVSKKDLEETIEKILKNWQSHQKQQADNKDKTEKENLPELNEELVKNLGNFKSVEDFKNKVQESLLKEKEAREREKRRIAIIEKIINDSDMVLPDIIVEEELNRMEAQFKNDIKNAGLTVEDYLKHINKKEGDLRKEWREDAKKRAQIQLAINKIFVGEKMKMNNEKIEKETEAILSQHKDLNRENVRDYVENIMLNEQVFSFLENLSEEKK